MNLGPKQEGRGEEGKAGEGKAGEGRGREGKGLASAIDSWKVPTISIGKFFPWLQQQAENSSLEWINAHIYGCAASIITQFDILACRRLIISNDS